MDDDYQLAEFEAWCRGKGRPPGAGVHYTALTLAENYRKFRQREKELAIEQLRKKAEKDLFL